jgi:hypothetical protein
MAHYEEEDTVRGSIPVDTSGDLSETLITQRHPFLYRSARAVSMSV